MERLDAANLLAFVSDGNVGNPGCRKERMDPVGYARHEPYVWQLDREALERTRFLREPDGGHQHLDVGCGTGGFTRNVLLPLSGSARRIVGADVSPSMLEFARLNNTKEGIVFELLDIGSEPYVSAFVAKHGQFDRVYSLLCFHMVPDQAAAFRNIGRLLSPDGECLVTAGVTIPAVDAWLDVHLMPEWNNLVPDPRAVMPSSSVHFNYTGTMAQIEKETREYVTAAGLECVACEVMECTWLSKDIKSLCDVYVDSFLMGIDVAPRDRDILEAAYAERLRLRLTETPSGFELPVGIYRVHARPR